MADPHSPYKISACRKGHQVTVTVNYCHGQLATASHDHPYLPTAIYLCCQKLKRQLSADAPTLDYLTQAVSHLLTGR